MFEGSRRWPARICRSSSAHSAGVPTRIARAPAPVRRRRASAATPVSMSGMPGATAITAKASSFGDEKVGHAEQGAEAPGRLGVAGDDRDLAAALGVGLGGADDVRDGAHGLDAAREEPDERPSSVLSRWFGHSAADC